ncbi:MAG: hypothetical protein FWH04_09430 [Oscillospiraceae bacterium]|nr:hypothetical protein [Oscillospiraceae bacterium]
MSDVDVKVELVDQYGDPYPGKMELDFDYIRKTVYEIEEMHERGEQLALNVLASAKDRLAHNTRLALILGKASGYQSLLPTPEELEEKPDFLQFEPEKEPPPVVRPKMTGADRNIFLRGNVKEPPPWVKKPEPEKQTSKILPLTAEMRAEYEKHDKEWQESKYAKNMPLANARIFSRMSDEEKAKLPESTHNYLFMYYEQNKERIKQDEEEQNTRDILGYIPGIGSVAEGISAYHAFEKGSIGEGFLYAVGSVPVGKYAVKGGKVALKSFRKVPRKWFKAGKVGKVASKLPKTTRKSVEVKLNKYLLDLKHPEGGDKAKWFKEALGFTKKNSEELAKQIVFDPQKAVKGVTTEFGTKFNQVIPIKGANGRMIDVKFGWIKNNDGVVRLVTAIPTKK